MTALKDRYINPLTDFGFKKLFGTEVNKNLLIDFLNQVLPNHHRIKDLTYSKNEHIGDNEMDRKAIFDLYCIGENGERFIVELQKAKQNYFKDRSIYYSSFPIQEQAEKGEWNFKLEPVYTIGILDFIFTEHKNDMNFFHLAELKDQKNRIFYDKLKYIYIELPKFQKKVDELETHFDKWLYVFRHLSKLRERPAKLQAKVFTQLFKSAEIAMFTPQERHAYETSLKYYRDLKNVTDTAKEEGRKEGIEEGLKKGIEKGKKEGIEEGLKKGIEKGKKEGIEEGLKKGNLLMAKRMKLANMPIEQIMKFAGLSKAEIENL